MIAGSVFTILAFGGFEGAAPLAEEARNPRRTIQRAVLLSTLLIGALYVFTTYAIDVAFGPAQFHNFTTGATPTASWVGVARSLYGIFWFFVFLAIVNSTIANANAGVNVSSRTAYAMGRIRVFPSFLAHINARHRSPVYSILAAFVITIAVTLGLGLHYTAPVAFAMVGTGIVILLVAIYILMNVACIGYFARKRTGFNVLSHLIIPLLGIAAVRARLAERGRHQGVQLHHPPVAAVLLYGTGRGRLDGHRVDLPDLPLRTPQAAGHRGRHGSPGPTGGVPE